MGLYKFLDQERTPTCTAISLLTTVAVEVVMFLAARSLPHAGFGAIGLFYLTALVVIAGLLVNIAAGFLAYRRREYWGGRIAAMGIALWLLTMSVPYFRAKLEARSRTWGAAGSILDVVVQRDGKLVLLGQGIVRLLPNGERDVSFRRDHVFAKKDKSLEDVENGWTGNGCAVGLSNGDLLLAANGWVGRVFSDGRDGPSFSVGFPGRYTACWGLAVQSDGMVITGWAFGPGRNTLSRNLPDGGADLNFNRCTSIAPWFQAGEIALQNSGKIVLAGWVRSPYRNTIALGPLDLGGCFTALTRLNADGTPDRSFTFAQKCRPKEYAAPGPSAFAVLRDGSMLFTSNVNRDGRIWSDVIHVDSNGTEIRESRLRHALQDFITISAIVPMNDGRILVGGRKSLDSPGGAVVERLFEDGRRDLKFHVRGGFQFVKRVRLQGDKIIVLDSTGDLQRLDSEGDRDPTFKIPVLRVHSH